MHNDLTSRIVLSEGDFRDLVAGRAVRPRRGVEIILSDIGWDRMQAAIEHARLGQPEMEGKA